MPQFAFFPYFPNEIFDQRFNRVHLFNFARFGEKYIPDVEMRTRIDQYCALYVDSEHRRSSTLTIAVIDNKNNFDNLTQEQETDLFRYSGALLFCSVVNNRQNDVCVSEQFNLAIQRFMLNTNNSPQYDYIFSETGSIFNTTNGQSLASARFVRPSFVPSNTLIYRYDKHLMSAFANMIDAHNPDDGRYFRVLDWIRYAYMNAEGYSPESRHVMLATAFEIFFDLPKDDKTNEFVRHIEKLLEVDKMTVPDESSNASQLGLPLIPKPYIGRGGRTKFTSHTIYGWWAREFYDLRSKIVHGDDITNEDIRNHKGEKHFFIAFKILRFCFYKLLENKGYLNYKVITDVPSLAEWDKYSTLEELRKVEGMIN